MTTEERLTESIQLVSHEVRADILMALAAHARETDPDETLGFAALRRRVGHDDPGNFNYHLGQLRGNLVTSTEEGYCLSDIGQQYVGLLVSGRFDPGESRELPAAETTCPVCAAPSTVEYESGVLRTDCPDGHASRLAVGPELLDEWSVETTLTIALRRSLFEARSVIDGVCPFCEGRTDGTLRRVDEGTVPVRYEAQCECCGMVLSNTAGGCVLFHPAVVTFCYRHGVDVYRSAWQVMSSAVEKVTVEGEEPFRVAVEFVIDGDSLGMSVDRSAEVVGVDGL